MKEKDIFTDWYQNRFNDLNEQPPDVVWNAISDELDVNEIWNNVDTKLTKVAKRKSSIRKIVWTSSIFLLLLNSAAYLYFENTPIRLAISAYQRDNASTIKNSSSKFQAPNSKSQIPNTVAENLNPQSPITNPQNQVPSFKFQDTNLIADNPQSLNLNPQSPFTNPQNQVPSSKFQDTNLIADNPQSLIPNPHSPITNPQPPINGNIPIANLTQNSLLVQINTDTLIEKDLSIINKTNNKPDLRIYFMPTAEIKSTLFQPEICALTDNTKPSKSPSNNGIKDEFTGLYGGGTYSLNNTWLLNNLTFSGLGVQSLHQTNMHFNNTWGVAVGYNLNFNWGVEINGSFNSNQVQTYHVYDEGHYQTKQIKLNYTNLNLSVKHRKSDFNYLFNKPCSNNMIVGLNIGFMKDGTESNGEVTEQVNQYYYKKDYGIKLGYEYELLFFNRMIVSSALYSDIGLRNIFKGDVSFPGGFNSTHTAKLHLDLGVKYLMK